ncbi:MAG: hypothetical protein JXA21_02820 [Anaerolineae bacterium]|nr:hypothetical protein [Anaerolineae bacterium]
MLTHRNLSRKGWLFIGALLLCLMACRLSPRPGDFYLSTGTIEAIMNKQRSMDPTAEWPDFWTIACTAGEVTECHLVDEGSTILDLEEEITADVVREIGAKYFEAATGNTSLIQCERDWGERAWECQLDRSNDGAWEDLQVW